MSHQRYTVPTTPKAWSRVYKSSPKPTLLNIEELAISLSKGITLKEIQEKWGAKVVAVKPSDKLVSASSLSETEPIIKLAKEIVLQVWVKNDKTNTLESRFIVCALPKQEKESKISGSDISIFDHTFGNVDLIIIPDLKANKINKCTKSDINILERRNLVSIARYLDHGQTLNLSTFGEVGLSKLQKERKKPPMDAHRQYFEEFCTYYTTAPNGKLLQRKFLRNIALLHETDVKELILSSKKLKAAAGGCIGSVIYTTHVLEGEALGAHGKIIGAHGLALNKRMHEGNVDAKHFIFIQVDNKSNDLTNWMERLGFGRLWLEAAFTLEDNQSKEEKKILKAMSEDIYKHTATENKRILGLQTDLFHLQASNEQNKFNPVSKYGKILRVQEEIFRAQELVSGMADLLYEQRMNTDSTSYKAYHQAKSKANESLIDLQKKLQYALDEVKDPQLHLFIQERDKKHYNEVVRWYRRVYKEINQKEPEESELVKFEKLFPKEAWKEYESFDAIVKNHQKLLAYQTINRKMTVPPDFTKHADVIEEFQRILLLNDDIADLQKFIDLDGSNEELATKLDMMRNKLQSMVIAYSSAKKGLPKDVYQYLECIEITHRILELEKSIAKGDDPLLRLEELQGYLKTFNAKLKELSQANGGAYIYQCKEMINLISHNLTALHIYCDASESKNTQFIVKMEKSLMSGLDPDLLEKLRVDTKPPIVLDIDMEKRFIDYSLLKKEHELQLKQLDSFGVAGIYQKDIFHENELRQQLVIQAALHDNPILREVMTLNEMNSANNNNKSKLNVALQEVPAQYASMYELLCIAQQYRLQKHEMKSVNNSTEREKLNQFFNIFWTCLDKTQDSIKSDRMKNSNLINNIIFESLKDYIMLYQKTPESETWKKVESYEMDNQYEAFFSMIPSIRFKGEWNTGTKFRPTLDSIQQELTCHGVPLDTQEAIANFQRFFLNRMTYYLNVACLEGCELLPEPSAVKSFEDLARILPNLAGVLLLGVTADMNSPSVFWTGYQQAMREIYEASYTERDICLPIKSGLGGTEEIGLRPGVPCEIVEISIGQNKESDVPIYLVEPTGLKLDVTIGSEMSERGGLTTDRYEGGGHQQTKL